jgi:hypothetical protein
MVICERAPSVIDTRVSHEDLAQIYRENLEPDFEPSRHTSYDRSGLLLMLEELLSGRRPRHMSLIVVKDNSVHAIPLTKVQPQLTAKRVAFLVDGLKNATTQGLKLQV